VLRSIRATFVGRYALKEPPNDQDGCGPAQRLTWIVDSTISHLSSKRTRLHDCRHSRPNVPSV
jgi:hypothetical protein